MVGSHTENLARATERIDRALKTANLDPNLTATLEHFLHVFASLPEQTFDVEWTFEQHLSSALHVVARGLEYYVQTRSDLEQKFGNTLHLPSGRRFEVYATDAPRPLTWGAAVDWCASLGKGWRLPTREELDILRLAKDQQLGDLPGFFYWTSEESKPNGKYAYGLYMSDGDIATFAKTAEKWVRAVRTVPDKA